MMALDEATKQHLEKDLLPFLNPETRSDIKSVTLRYFLEMTGSQEGRDFITEGDKFLPAILNLTSDKEKDIMRDALLAAINISADESAVKRIMKLCPSFILDLMTKVLRPDFLYADEASSVISNITRFPEYAEVLGAQILKEGSEVSVDKIVSALCVIGYNKKANLHYLGTILANLTQVSGIRKCLLDKQRCIVQKLLSFTEFKDSLIRRGGIVGTLKNCCFEYDTHVWLLSEEVDILSRLLLPLAGGEEFDDDDMEKLPVDLQYLPPDKEREPDPDIRAMLLEAITLLCSTKHCRMLIKSQNAYIILRELHKWERDPKAKLACQKLCELLISDEPEEGMEDLHKVEVPANLEERFNKMDLDLLRDFEKEHQQEGGASEEPKTQ